MEVDALILVSARILRIRKNTPGKNIFPFRLGAVSLTPCCLFPRPLADPASSRPAHSSFPREGEVRVAASGKTELCAIAPISARGGFPSMTRNTRR